MVKNHFTIEEDAIAELLGRQFYKSEEAAIFELIKNSYDANATYCVVLIQENEIKIIDNGHGMNYKDIQTAWLHIGKSNKDYFNEDGTRVYAGSKGVGRFALARLGDEVIVYSKKEGFEGVCWTTNWEDSSFAIEKTLIDRGTVIQIKKLRINWNEKRVNNLLRFFERAYKSEEMQIIIKFKDQDYLVSNIFENLRIGENYSVEIDIAYLKENTTILLEVKSKEFEDIVKTMLPTVNIESYKESLNLSLEFKDEADTGMLEELGSFSSKLYFAMTRNTKAHMEEFKYRKTNYDFPKTGVVLYRNAFSLSTLDGSTDWLEITARARKSPAAASHKTGSWRVRSNQLTGYILIDKRENKHIKDLSNRQGIEDNDYSQLLKRVIGICLNRFEAYRQNIIREIKNLATEEVLEEKDVEIVKKFIKDPTSLKDMAENEVVKLAKIVEDIQNDAEKQIKARKESEEQHKYEVRILNVLATQGLRASAIAHELQNKRNFLDKFYNSVVNALKKYNYWDDLNSPEKTKKAYKNVPKLLEDVNDINLRLISFIDVILNKIKKEKFKTNIKSISTQLNNIINTWESEYSWINFHVSNNVPEEMDNIKISRDALEVIFDNLILNSVQHNSHKQQLIITIDVNYLNECLYIQYKDDGIGLDEKYKNNPMRIMEVHETSRNDGHGLGMWIINNTVQMYNGEVLNISGDIGFKFDFRMRGL